MSTSTWLPVFEKEREDTVFPWNLATLKLLATLNTPHQKKMDESMDTYSCKNKGKIEEVAQLIQ